MNYRAFSLGTALVLSSSFAFGETMRVRTDGPCFQVSAQNKPVNEASVQQSCDQNFNRILQAGAVNRAQTTQTGKVNDNKVRQYSYDLSRYFERSRRGRSR